MSHYRSGGVAVLQDYKKRGQNFEATSPPHHGKGPYSAADILYYNPSMMFKPSMNSLTGNGGSSSGGKAKVVEELKALILAAEPGTGQIARYIEEAQFAPRHNAFTSLLQLASKSRQPAKAIEIFEAMQSVAGIAPNTFSYSALISALARVGNWEQAEKYFNDLKEQAKTNPDMKPNTVTYAAMISGE